MSDRELLEKAAKAAGLRVVDDHAHIPSGGMWLVGADEDQVWSPLINDGDALRLAVKLRMKLDCMPWRVEATAEESSDVQPVVNADPYAATRRAIVRAAAALVEKPQV